MFADKDGLGFKVLVFLGGAGEEEGVGDGGFALGNGGDDVGAAQPVGFGKVGERPLRGVVGVGVVEAGDVEALAAGLALDFDQFERGDLVAVVGGVGAGVAGGDGGFNLPAVGGGMCRAGRRSTRGDRSARRGRGSAS